MSTSFEAIVQNEGRLLIPVQLRRSLGIEPGTRVVLREEGDGLVLTPVTKVKQRLRALFADVEGSMADELIAERRDEATKDTP